ncbi:hypothetical protein CYMTET_33332 [Cymbomonas tetramitiformis]|uniref:Uncharacterized protein n=1 Tax=Cymbomonas tetramitiformis TaxID=36881 RepID=A0AAE0FDB7_9CHLO|nr:hypothetical protein CYMTET_33332 [Cymbomonas tetramitiformis]
MQAPVGFEERHPQSSLSGKGTKTATTAQMRTDQDPLSKLGVAQDDLNLDDYWQSPRHAKKARIPMSEDTNTVLRGAPIVAADARKAHWTAAEAPKPRSTAHVPAPQSSVRPPRIGSSQ